MTLKLGQLGLIVTGVAVLLLAATRPWVVKPLDAEGHAIVGPVAFDAEAFARKAWTEQLPAKADAAAELSAAGPVAKLLKGQGIVTSVDTKSRVGIALVDVDPQDGKADVALQVGPVVTGAPVRDALGLQFADFDTQVDYANVGKSLNRQAMAATPVLADPKALEGKHIAFVGAGSTTPQGQVRMVPVRLTVLP